MKFGGFVSEVLGTWRSPRVCLADWEALYIIETILQSPLFRLETQDIMEGALVQDVHLLSQFQASPKPAKLPQKPRRHLPYNMKPDL